MTELNEFVKNLEREGYSIEYNTQIKGASGVSHRVDGLARGSRNSKMILWLEKRADSTIEIIKAFAISLDVGAEPCLVLDGGIGEEDRKLADSYKMRLLTK